MDRAEKLNRWAWLPSEMPGVARLMAEKREQLGAAWVGECWRRGMGGETGWFFAREGPIAVGTPWEAADLTLQVTATQAMLIMRTPDVAKGAGKTGAGHGAA